MCTMCEPLKGQGDLTTYSFVDIVQRAQRGKVANTGSIETNTEPQKNAMACANYNTIKHSSSGNTKQIYSTNVARPHC
jgi:hypothetical protein